MGLKYEEKAYDELLDWQRKIRKRGNKFGRMSKNVQNKLNAMIPEKVHQVFSEAVKGMVQSVLSGSNLVFKKTFPEMFTLEEKEEKIKEQLDKYRKTATIEGAGTGAGGLLLGLADFPLLLSIKLKFLYDVARIYQYDLKNLEERIFLLMVFQLAFSSDEKRIETLNIIENWDTEKKRLTDLDWKRFQQEYRDYIDIVKMLQLVPGIGAAVGAYANYKLLDRLGETAIYAYRMRYFNQLKNIKAY
ncbi:EcsC family protein [Caldibacillus thermolactis]|uniref:EcsC family protein n=1 Tax=Pallidibacillus thermolactis TaxID=251051 RepID=A0ABT2WGW0_9BACI|nr:EcsC family protein [Pallidibacillus thermolactis]MCU9594939.1 EcsC family protein [Pallidibacillus thermolactis]MCU9601817.1 EcsC family protein [Pallidibacillus thermolactis subsp. kokeshiiformis]MED1674071.1 EcsC family protein [Pallidibacillus thermolactis subsp. kokeshiiformis]